MVRRLVVVASLLIVSVTAIAIPAHSRAAMSSVLDLLPAESTGSGPATSPATQPSATSATHPSTSPATVQATQADVVNVAYFDLDGPISEQPAGFSLFGNVDQPYLQDLVDRILSAADDPDIQAVLVTVNGAQLGLAQAQELRDALHEVTDAGKKVYIYADSYDTDTYILATGASDICLMTGGELELPGVGVETMFAKGLLDKLGVQADYIQIGEYKGAEEPFTRSSASPELAGELTHLTEALYGQIVDGISQYRALPREKVRQVIDQVMVDATEAKSIGLIDHVVEMEDLREFIAKDQDDKINIIHDYGVSEEPEIDLSNIFSLLAAINRPVEKVSGPEIGVIYLDGTIVDGSGGDGLTGDRSIGSDDIRKALRIASRDDQVKAVVIRIDSPGGSALASEAIWQAVRKLNAKKPVIVSVGGMAASGGYYVASASDYIIADSSAIVGSIGVVGGKFVLKDLFDKLGLTAEVYSKGANATLFSSSTAWTPAQRDRVRAWMQKTYEQFTQRIMTTRGKRIADIDKVARGRIFIAEQAKALGLVDDIGGLDKTIQYAADKVGLEVGDYHVRSIPAPQTLADLINGRPETATPLKRAMAHQLGGQMSADQMLLWQMIPADGRQLIMQQVRFAKLLQDRPIVLCAPFVVQVH